MVEILKEEKIQCTFKHVQVINMNVPDVNILRKDLSKYENDINTIISLLEKYFQEKVKIHYTFEDYNNKNVFCFDLDFYLLENKNKLKVSNAGKKKLAVCFVIMPPLFKDERTNKFILRDEGIYLVKNNGIKWLYKNEKVNDLSWNRLFSKSISLLKIELKMKNYRKDN